MNGDSVHLDEIIERLCGEVEAVCRDLGIRGHRSQTSRSFVGDCPWNHPSAKHEPKLYVDCRRIPGAWIDFRSGAKGDILWLIAMVRSGGVRSKDALSEAIGWAKDRYGLTQHFDRAKWQQGVEANRLKLAKMQAESDALLKKERGRAFSQWLKGEVLKEGQLGYEYFRARAIDFRRLGRIPRAIRFIPDLPYFEDGIEIHRGPGIGITMTQADGSFGSLHKTWIDARNVGDKADLGKNARGKARKVRRMWPDSGGCVMRLWRGKTGLSEREAAGYGLLEDVVVGEGAEDALSVAMCDPDKRIIAAGSLSGLMLMTPPAVTDTLIIAADNDWNNPMAKGQLDAACRRFIEEFSLTVKIARSPVGKDFNNLLRGEHV